MDQGIKDGKYCTQKQGMSIFLHFHSFAYITSKNPVEVQKIWLKTSSNNDRAWSHQQHNGTETEKKRIWNREVCDHKKHKSYKARRTPINMES